MDAVISGRAGIAVLLGTQPRYLRETCRVASTNADAIPQLVGRYPDMTVFEDVDSRQIRDELNVACKCDDSLHLALILLDRDLPQDIRQEAANSLDELVRDERVMRFVESILYARPFPQGADPQGALGICKAVNASTVGKLCSQLVQRQTTILAVCIAWTAIPNNVFSSNNARRDFEREAVRLGCFRDLVLAKENSRIGYFLVEALTNPQLKRLEEHRAVLLMWTNPFRESRTRTRIAAETDYLEDVEDEPREKHVRHKTREKSSVTVARVKLQKAAITEALNAGDVPRAAKYIADLRVDQLKHGGGRFLAKSLCDLAMDAKRRGYFNLQLDLTAQAVEVRPSDGWAWGQYGDALLIQHQTVAAIDAFKEAESLGELRIGRIGQAQALKIEGRSSEALAAYDSIIVDFPRDIFAQNGRAEVLKSLNKLNEALLAYDAILVAHPNEIVSRNGRAEVLKSLNRLPEALAAYDTILAEFPDEVVSQTGRAGVLKSLNRLDEALASYDDIILRHPDSVFAKIGRAETLKRLYRFDEALSTYNAVIAAHPEEVVAKTGRAEILKNLNRLGDALSAYDEIIAAHPYQVVVKNGRASVLASLNHLSDALAAYDNTIAAHPYDAASKCGRAEVLKKLNRLHEALDAYNTIIISHPENVIAKSGRAEVLKSLNRLEEALAAYDDIVTAYPEELVAKRGRADVLKSLSRLDEALATYDAILKTNPEDIIARNGRAEVLNSLNLSSEALRAYDDVIAAHPEDLISKCGRAALLTRLNRSHEALEAYEAVTKDYPEDVVAWSGRAEVLKRLGRLDEALRAFDVILTKWPHNRYAQTGRSSTLLLLGRVEEVLAEQTSKEPVTPSDWVAYHIRGIAFLLSEDFGHALEIFKHGSHGDPRPNSRAYFQAGLAMAKVCVRDYDNAVEALEIIDAPQMKTPVAALKIHAYGELGRREEAMTAYLSVPARSRSDNFEDVFAELHDRYLNGNTPRFTEEWLVRRETKMLLVV